MENGLIPTKGNKAGRAGPAPTPYGVGLLWLLEAGGVEVPLPSQATKRRARAGGHGGRVGDGRRVGTEGSGSAAWLTCSQVVCMNLHVLTENGGGQDGQGPACSP